MLIEMPLPLSFVTCFAMSPLSTPDVYSLPLITIHSDCTRRFPVELFTYTLDQLSQPDVLRAAGVCKRWRAISRRHRNYYRHISYGHAQARWWYTDSSPLQPAEAYAQPLFWRAARAFQRAAEDACVTGTPLSVRVRVAHCPRGSVVFATSLDRKVRNTLLGFVLPALRAALATACRLHLEVPLAYGDVFMAALSERAPRLRSLYLYAEGAASAIEIPSGLFRGDAPMLASVSFHGQIALSPDGAAVPAFSRVQDVDLQLEAGVESLAGVAHHFPGIRNIVCDIGRLSTFSESFLPRYKDRIAASLSLLRSFSFALDFGGSKACMRSPGADVLDFVLGHCENVCEVELCLRGSESGPHDVPSVRGLLDNTSKSVSLALEQATNSAIPPKLSPYSELYYRDFADPTMGLRMSIITADRSYSRTIEFHRDGPCLEWCIDQLASVREQITSLRIWHGYLQGGLDFFAALPGVEQLSVDLCGTAALQWDPEKEARRLLPRGCPSDRRTAATATTMEREPRTGSDVSSSAHSLGNADEAASPPLWPRLRSLTVFNSHAAQVIRAAPEQLLAYARLLHVAEVRPVLRVAQGVETQGGRDWSVLQVGCSQLVHGQPFSWPPSTLL